VKDGGVAIVCLAEGPVEIAVAFHSRGVPQRELQRGSLGQAEGLVLGVSGPLVKPLVAYQVGFWNDG
jgi:hypothetical protein